MGLRKKLDLLIENIVIILFSLLCIIVFCGVVARYVFNAPLIWSHEVIIYLFTWVVFLGSAIAYKNNRHISISLINSFLSKSWQKAISIIGEIVVFAFLALLFYLSIKLTQLNIDVPSVTIPVPTAVVTISVPVMSILMIYYCLSSLIAKIKDIYED